MALRLGGPIVYSNKLIDLICEATGESRHGITKLVLTLEMNKCPEIHIERRLINDPHEPKQEG